MLGVLAAHTAPVSTTVLNVLQTSRSCELNPGQSVCQAVVCPFAPTPTYSLVHKLHDIRVLAGLFQDGQDAHL